MVVKRQRYRSKDDLNKEKQVTIQLRNNLPYLKSVVRLIYRNIHILILIQDGKHSLLQKRRGKRQFADIFAARSQKSRLCYPREWEAAKRTDDPYLDNSRRKAKHKLPTEYTPHVVVTEVSKDEGLDNFSQKNQGRP